MLQVLPFARVDSHGIISSKEKATPRDISVAFLAYLDHQGPLEQMVLLDLMVELAFQEEMVEMAEKEKRVKRGLKVMNNESLVTPLLTPNFKTALSLFLLEIAL